MAAPILALFDEDSAQFDSNPMEVRLARRAGLRYHRAMNPGWRPRLADAAVTALILFSLLGAAAPDFYRYQDVRAHRDVMRQLNEAEQAYQIANPHLGYACSLEDLAESGGLTASLAEGDTESYVIELGCRGRRRLGVHTSYYIHLRPKHGDRPWLCSDESGLVATDRLSLMTCVQNLSEEKRQDD